MLASRWFGRHCLIWLAALAPFLYGQANETDELEAVRAGIQALEKKLSEKHAAKDSAGRQLADLELQIAAATVRLKEIQRQLSGQSKEQERLERDRADARQRLGREQQLLADQVRQSHRAGSTEPLKLLLNQGNPARLGRMMTYYGYISSARTERIETVRKEMQQLENLEQQARQLAAAMAESEALQRQTVAGLQASRGERKALLQRLDDEIAAGGAEMAKLREQESTLAELVAQLAQELAGFPTNSEKPFAAVRGELAWPLRGRLLADFGQPRSGSVRWNGVLIGADRGTPVRALYHGRVVFADWLTGMGLLVVIDHGGGFMSLYGHNDAVLKEAGDWVEPGQVISEVGESGGQSQPGLYLEIRRAGEPLNPNRWIGSRLAAR